PPLPAAASPTADSPGYIPESDPDEDLEDDDEDPKEDPADYPADHNDDEEEEPSGDDADEEVEEQDEDDDEEEHSASADSIPPPPLLSSDRRADRLDVTLPPRKRLNMVHRPRYEAGESSAAAAARLIEGRKADYRFVGSVKAEIRRRIAADIGYGIRDTWIDTRDVAEEEALMTLEGVNTRVTELATVQTEIFQRVEALVDDSQYHYETGRLVDQEARCSREAWTHSIRLSSAVHFELQGYMTPYVGAGSAY
nr:hypothetical protein [Tanacetum cinerariifolium]